MSLAENFYGPKSLFEARTPKEYVVSCGFAINSDCNPFSDPVVKMNDLGSQKKKNNPKTIWNFNSKKHFQLIDCNSNRR